MFKRKTREDKIIEILDNLKKKTFVKKKNLSKFKLIRGGKA